MLDSRVSSTSTTSISSRLLAEFFLMRLPQRIDVVILEQVGEERGEVRKLHSIFDYLRATRKREGDAESWIPEPLAAALGR